jgi:hypothetical protein
MLAALIYDAKLPILGRDQGMVAGDSRVGDHQIFVDLSPDCERRMVEIDRALVVSLHKNQGWKNTRSR